MDNKIWKVAFVLYVHFYSQNDTYVCIVRNKYKTENWFFSIIVNISLDYKRLSNMIDYEVVRTMKYTSILTTFILMPNTSVIFSNMAIKQIWDHFEQYESSISWYL